MAEFSLDLSEEQRDLRDWVHGFAAGTVRPAAAEWDRREETPWPVISEAAKIGLYGFEFLANAWSDPTGLSLCLANEELFWGDAGIGLSIMGTSLAVAAIYGSGTPEQLREWVPPCFGTADAPAVAAFCTTEPGAGSDAGAIRTRAVYHEARDEWVLTGQKAFATNGGIAAVHVVTAAVDPALGTRGQAAFVIPPDTPGLTAGPKLRKLGLRASHTADVFLDEVRVPGRCLLGGREALDTRLARARAGQPAAAGAAAAAEPAQASSQATPSLPALRTFELSRPAVGAQAVGIARAGYEYALAYARDRVQFGRPIVEHQAVGFALADMCTELDAARLLVWRAAWMGKNNRPFDAGEGSMSKLKAGEVAVREIGRAHV